MPQLFGSRKVEFRDDVSVYNFECDDDHTDSGSQSSLEVDSTDTPDSGSRFQATSKQRVALSAVSGDNYHRTSDVPEKPRWNQMKSLETTTATRKKTRSSHVSTTIRFNILDDAIRGRTLQLWIMLGTSFGPEGVMVKTNSRGEELEILACKRKRSSSKGGVDVGTEYTACLPLPAVVVPKSLCARVDRRGCLMIEARISTG